MFGEEKKEKSEFNFTLNQYKRMSGVICGHIEHLNPGEQLPMDIPYADLGFDALTKDYNFTVEGSYTEDGHYYVTDGDISFSMSLFFETYFAAADEYLN